MTREEAASIIEERVSVTEYVQSSYVDGVDIEALRIAYKALERQEQRWIPCSERLPEDYEDVLVWFEYFRYGNYNCLYQMYGIGSYSSGYNSWLINQETGWNELKVFAWMPLPPYKGEQECAD